MKIIDAHLHLFDIDNGDYLWLKKENPPFWSDKPIINKNFTEQDIVLANDLEHKGFVHIEAGFDNNEPWREIAWLESSCNTSFRSVASIDITLNEQAFNQQLTALLAYSSVVGCRYILDEQASALLTNDKVLNNLALLAKNSLSFDVQMSLADNKAVNALCNVMTKYKNLSIIIDHAGWPPQQLMGQNSSVDNGNWLQGLTKVSQYRQCTIKCSGFEVVNRDYSAQWQSQVVNACIDCFGMNRVMLASNFPLCLFSHSYQNLWGNYKTQLNLKATELTIICHDNAKRIYKFN